MILPGTYHDRSLKLGVGIKLTSAIRTISPASAYLGPRFSAQVVPVLKMNKNILTVAKELSSAVYNHPDSDLAKHCAAIVRESHENTSEERGERLIVCTSLVESGHSGVNGNIPAIIRVFKLDTEEKRIAWLDRLVQSYATLCILESYVLSTPQVRSTILRSIPSFRTREWCRFRMSPSKHCRPIRPEDPRTSRIRHTRLRWTACSY